MGRERALATELEAGVSTPTSVCIRFNLLVRWLVTGAAPTPVFSCHAGENSPACTRALWPQSRLFDSSVQWPRAVLSLLAFVDKVARRRVRHDGSRASAAIANQGTFIA